MHLHYRDLAESAWTEASHVASDPQAALFYAQMATYEATRELIDRLDALTSVADDLATGRGSTQTRSLGAEPVG